MRVLLDVYGMPTQNDLMCWDEKKQCWACVQKGEFLGSVRKEFSDKITAMEKDEAEYRKQIAEKLLKINDQINTIAIAIGGK